MARGREGAVVELAEQIAAVRAGEGDPREMIGEFRRTAVLVPLSKYGPQGSAQDSSRDGPQDGTQDGFMSAEYGGIRWIYAFTDEAPLARFALARGAAPGEEWEFATVLGARLLDVIIPDLAVPAGVAVDVADEDGAMMFPPVRGIVPDACAVDAEEDDGGSAGEDAR